MIVAKTEGKLVYAKDCIDKEVRYKCPCRWCTYPDLILKRGLVKSPHFSHKMIDGDNTCERHGERMTEAHIAMQATIVTTLGIPIDQVEYTSIPESRTDSV